MCASVCMCYYCKKCQPDIMMVAGHLAGKLAYIYAYQLGLSCTAHSLDAFALALAVNATSIHRSELSLHHLITSILEHDLAQLVTGRLSLTRCFIH